MYFQNFYNVQPTGPGGQWGLPTWKRRGSHLISPRFQCQSVRHPQADVNRLSHGFSWRRQVSTPFSIFYGSVICLCSSFPRMCSDPPFTVFLILNFTVACYADNLVELLVPLCVKYWSEGYLDTTSIAEKFQGSEHRINPGFAGRKHPVLQSSISSTTLCGCSYFIGHCHTVVWR